MTRMIDNLEFRHLRYFVAVAEECNFNRAARRLHLAQPSLSNQIRQLEEALNVKLFVRSTAGTMLTVAGLAFLPHAKRLLVLREQAIEQTVLAQTGVGAPFRLGLTSWAGDDLLREALIAYKRLVPDGVLEPSTHSSWPLMRSVLEGQLDAALVNLPPIDETLSVERVLSRTLSVCMRSDDPAAAHPSVPRTLLSGRINIMFDRALHPLLFDQIEKRFETAGIRFRPTRFVSHPSEVQLLVREGSGFGLIREGASPAQGLVSRPVMGLNIPVRTAVVSLPTQRRPVFPLLAHTLSQRFARKEPALKDGAPEPRIVQQASLFEEPPIDHSLRQSITRNKVLDRTSMPA